MEPEPGAGNNRREEIRQRLDAVGTRMDELRAEGEATQPSSASRSHRLSATWPPRRQPPTGRLLPVSAPSAGQPTPTSRLPCSTNEP